MYLRGRYLLEGKTLLGNVLGAGAELGIEKVTVAVRESGVGGELGKRLGRVGLEGRGWVEILAVGLVLWLGLYQYVAGLLVSSGVGAVKVICLATE